MGASAAEIETFLIAYGKALSAGDGATIATMYEIPGLVLSDVGSIPVTSAEQVDEFFSAVPDQYAAQGITATRAEYVAIEQLSDQLCTADVRWVGLDTDGRATLHKELATYVLRRDDSGTIRIQVAIARPSLTPGDD